MISLIPNLPDNYAYTRKTYQNYTAWILKKPLFNCATVNFHNFAKTVVLLLKYQQY
jgi:hypothetical protein